MIPVVAIEDVATVSSWTVDAGVVRLESATRPPRSSHARPRTPALDERRAREAASKRRWRAANRDRNSEIDRRAHAKYRERARRWS